MGKATISLEPNERGGGSLTIAVADDSIIGCDADLKLQFKTHVHDSRAVHSHRELLSRSVKLSSSPVTLSIADGTLDELYSYKGKHIDLRLQALLTIDDGILFDSDVESNHELPFCNRPRLGAEDGSTMNPKDVFNFFANLSAIPYRNRMFTVWLCLIGGVLILINGVVGIHDEFVPNAQTLFYDHVGSDGSESPLMKALAGCGAAGAAIWAMVMAQLRKYMQFNIKPHRAPDRGQRTRAGDLIDGRARVDLEDITVRVVACNRECGQYRRGSGTKVRTVSFSTPTRAVKLYERYIALVPANAPLSTYLDGDIDFEPMFSQLYPPLKLSSSHGVDVVWEVQLLHPKFVDHERHGDINGLRYADFLDP